MGWLTHLHLLALFYWGCEIPGSVARRHRHRGGLLAVHPNPIGSLYPFESPLPEIGRLTSCGCIPSPATTHRLLLPNWPQLARSQMRKTPLGSLLIYCYNPIHATFFRFALRHGFSDVAPICIPNIYVSGVEEAFAAAECLRF